MTVKIDQALTQAFIDGAFGLPIAHENASYAPTPGTAYAEIKVLTNDVLPSTLKEYADTTGLFQFVLRYPEGDGAIAAKTTADAVFDAFPMGQTFTYSGQRVTVAYHSRPDAVPEDGWFKVVGRIAYTADIERTQPA